MPEPHIRLPPAKFKGLLQGIHNAVPSPFSYEHPVHHHMEHTKPTAGIPVLQGNDLPFREVAGKAHPTQFDQDLTGGRPVDWKGEGNHCLGALGQVLQGIPHKFGVIGYYGSAAAAAVELAQPGIEQFHIIGNLGHGAHSGARGADGILLINGDGRRDALNSVHKGPVHTLHKLAGIGRKGFHVPALALCIEGIKSQGGFSRSAYPSNHGDVIQGDFKIQVLEIVLPGTFDPNALVGHFVCLLPFHLINFRGS